MSFELLPADPADSPNLTTVFFSAFSNPFNQRLFPRTPDVTAYWTAQFTSFINNPHKTVLKIIDSEDGSIVAFAVWQLPVQSSPEDVHLKHPHSHSHAGDEHHYPASSDRELCEVFFGGMEEMKGRIMGARPHYYLEMLGTRPEYAGQGLASRLLRWGLERADEVGLETYLSASPVGRPLYEKFGFRVVEEREVVGGYVQGYMLRAGRVIN
ncbi:GNAT family N-acetyltransferase [Aspergillus fischeri NRRL 181]|uniref:Acetyltransferase, GNAT family family n=1 Tax=Neosartorya fischeri (strain ATCC 1020 / DSM 3700 / CBS 544.65 / FGSC A1164 / JCM 1740 / NRRL 181 / WB 181) TaxID=331117 RepID=A1DBH7_NEOFI|nr:acetyltransferase, GNAT family family [Aspergillus fischeri NRRL 181]EAW20217.1 acetyltransferase, GNAT family family [Aspergillus fischeri NRRL 181]